MNTAPTTDHAGHGADGRPAGLTHARVRRRLVLLAPAAYVCGGLGGGLLMQRSALAQAVGAAKHLANLDAAAAWAEALATQATAKTTAGWPLGQVLEHLAQSIDFSRNGFPLPKSPWFQATAGRAAFAWFQWRGRMSHGLSEPIPGAPALRAATVAEGAAALRQAIAAFQTHTGPLKPHFAYGDLPKADYAQAHLMHIVNHRDHILG